MRRIIVFSILALTALGVMLILAGPVRANQSFGVAAGGHAVLTDTVVNPQVSVVQAPVTNVYWRGRHRGGWYRPYWRRYGYGGYYYGYRPHRCWWNGYRWVCRHRWW